MRDNVHEVNNELTNMNAAANYIITVTLLILTLMRPITISYVYIQMILYIYNQMIYLELHHGILKVYVANCAPIKGISTPLFNAMISSGFKNQFKSSKMNFIKILTCQIG